MEKGKVYLVGAGPGDEKLLTLKGMECIQKADVIVYDRLVNKSILRYKKEGCELIYVGKKSSFHSVPQEDINKIIVRKALEGMVVVRLKGGDPYVFGRGGEEAEVLYDEGIEFEVVPGITSAIGGVCYAGIPVTHRDYSNSFHIITGHSKKNGKLNINWDAVSNIDGTLVFLMSIGNIEEVVDNLVSNGKSGDTKVGFISWASTPIQKKVVTTLDNAVEIVKNKEIEAPALFVVGDVCSLSDKLDFHSIKPLFGKKILITRDKNKNSELKRKIEAKGGMVIDVPTISINTNYKNKDLVPCILEGGYNAVAFTSHNSVRSFFDIIKNKKIDVRILSKLKFFSIGKSTSIELEKNGIYDYIQSDIATAKALSEKIGMYSKENSINLSIIYPCSNLAKDDFIRWIDEGGNLAVRQEVYTNEIEEGYRDLLVEYLIDGDVDYITFTSSSTVENTIKLIGKERLELLKNIKIISIGEITTKTIKNYGLEIFKQSKEPSIDSMIDCLL